ncbi:MAG TPA: RNA methyltransferase, partial [Desulfomicrobiaceae bacterium]|nr:RNA methyltransferase [Desulfomicrobiaceae bacterium]
MGRSLAARLGLIYIQDISSMVPPLVLAPHPGDVVLDLCASPGSKTGMLAEAVGLWGMVVANEPNPRRLATLRANMRQIGAVEVVTTSFARFPRLPSAQGFPRILVDAPCSGWGTAHKHPEVLRLWRDDKTQTLESLQRALLARAAEILAPGGVLVYSTCTT